MISKFTITLIKISIIFIIFQAVTISGVYAFSWNEGLQAGENFIQKGKAASANGNKTGETVIDMDASKETTSNIYNMLVAFGVVLSVIIGGILGIQLMWGSIEQQVKAKEMLIPYAIGCVVIFGAFGIWKIAVNVFSGI